MKMGGNRNVYTGKCLAGVGMGMKLMGMWWNGKAESHSRTHLVRSTGNCHFKKIPTGSVLRQKKSYDLGGVLSGGGFDLLPSQPGSHVTVPYKPSFRTSVQSSDAVGSPRIFIARQHTDARYWYSKSVRLSVHLSVRNVPVSDENGLTYRHSFFHHTVAQSY